MLSSYRNFCFRGLLSALSIAPLLFFPSLSKAQLVPDNSLGAESSIVTPGQVIDLIRGGAIRGNAVFHSFDEFNVGEGRQVFFDLQNNTDIFNILTRVTGSSSSNILGNLGVLRDALNSTDFGDANLFLLNPNGITFGENAALLLNGSFLATTADGFDFNDFTFSSSGEEAPPPLLTVNLPPFLSFLDNPGDIVSQGSLIIRNPEGTVSLVGGNVTVSGNLGTLSDGRVEIGSVGGSGSVSLTETDLGYVLGYEGVETFEDITIDQARISTLGNGEDAGSVQIQGRNTTITGDSGIFANNFSSQTGGGIVINAEELVIEDSSSLSSITLGEGDAGNITITASQVLIQDQGFVRADTLFGEGDGGDISIQAEGNITIDNISVITSNISLGGSGNSGNITLKAASLNLINTSQLQAGPSSGTLGNGGDITIDVSGDVTIGGRIEGLRSAGILNTADPETTGDTGNITITAGGNVTIDDGRIFSGNSGSGSSGSITINASSLLVQGGSGFNTATLGEGNAGSVEITAGENVTFNDSIINSFASGSGNAGGININASSLLVQEETQFIATTTGEGDAGNIAIQAEGAVTIDGISLITSNIGSGASGDSGNITLTAASLDLLNTSQIQAGPSPGGIGNAGDITINVSGDVTIGGRTEDLNSAGIFSNSDPGSIGDSGDVTITAGGSVNLNDGRIFSNHAGSGNAGDVTINTPQLLIQNGGQINASILGVGNGGNIKLNVDDTILIEGTDSGIFSTAETGSTGNPGNITIDPQQVTISDDGTISVQSLGTGTGGNLTIISNNLTLDNGFVIAETDNTDGGNITLNIANLLLLRNGDGTPLISATAGGIGNGGNINIDTTFLVAFPNENSDMTANANRGDGGRVNITAEGIFGIQFRDNPTPDNDITVTSTQGSDGIVQLNTPDTNPAAGLNNLPEAPANPQPIQGCQTITEEGDATFVDKGRGGLPPNPYEALSNNDIWEDVETPTQLTENPRQVIEAQGWIINEKGNVELVADVAAARARMGCG